MVSYMFFFKDPLESHSVLETFTERNAQALFISAILLRFNEFVLELAEKTFLCKESDSQEKERLYGLVKSLAFKCVDSEIQQLENLLHEAKANSEFANALIGRFIDQRREACDYHDVFNTLATPPSK